MRPNRLLLTDSYKVSHYRQYPPGTETVYSYFESRGGRFAETVFFGLQYHLKRYLEGVVVDRASIDEAASFLAAHFGDPSAFNRSGWEHVLDAHGGRLPVCIRAVPEGTPVPVRNVLLTIENTDPACFWLTNYLETLIVQVWYPTTVATLSREIKKLLKSRLEATGDAAGLELMLHDFGFRGVSSVESAGVGAAAHLLNFRGSDTLAGAVLARDYYGAHMAAVSIPAAEHSTMTAWGPSGETAAFAHMLDQFPTGPVSVVSDSYDIERACRDVWGGALRDQVLARDGKVVVRPDSGDPAPTVLRVLEILGERFGTERNDKGYRVLPPQIGVIQGDGIDYDEAARILDTAREHGWAAQNLVFGMGGGLLQKLDRDTQKFALKCSWIRVNGEGRDVFKDPATDSGKASKAGRLKLVRGSGGLGTVRQEAPGEDLLRTVFLDGELSHEQDWEEIRTRAAL